MIIAAIDVSLTNTAICVGTSKKEWEIKCFQAEKKGDSLTDRIIRMSKLAKRITKHCIDNEVNSIWIENYSFGSVNKREVLAELGGILRYILIQHFGSKVYEVSPSAIKKHITGKGNASKEKVIAHIVKKYGEIFETNDEYDSFALFHYALKNTSK